MGAPSTSRTPRPRRKMMIREKVDSRSRKRKGKTPAPSQPRGRLAQSHRLVPRKNDPEKTSSEREENPAPPQPRGRRPDKEKENAPRKDLFEIWLKPYCPRHMFKESVALNFGDCAASPSTSGTALLVFPSVLLLNVGEAVGGGLLAPEASGAPPSVFEPQSTEALIVAPNKMGEFATHSSVVLDEEEPEDVSESEMPSLVACANLVKQTSHSLCIPPV